MVSSRALYKNFAAVFYAQPVFMTLGFGNEALLDPVAVSGDEGFDIALRCAQWHPHFNPAVFDIETKCLALLAHDFTLKLTHRFSGEDLREDVRC